MLQLTNNEQRMDESRVSGKITSWKTRLDNKEEVLYMLKEDITLFSSFFFKTPNSDEDFVPYAWQDLVFQDKSRRLNICVSRQGGKTQLAMLFALHFAYFNNNATILVVSKTYPQALEVMDKIHVFLKAGSKMSWDLLKTSERENRSVIKLKNPGGKTFSRIISVPATDAARGYTADLVIADEGAFWENGNYIFKQVVEPTTQKSKGRIILISTSNGAQGFFWETFESPHWNSYQFSWHAVPGTTDEEMSIKRDSMTELEFQSEYLAKFVSPQNAYFPYHMVQAARTKEAGNGLATSGRVAIGVDFGKINDNAVLMVGCVENPESPASEQVVKVVKRVVKPLGTLYSAVLAEVRALNLQYSPVKIVMDSTGVGEVPTELLSSEGLPVLSYKFSIQSKKELYTPLKILFEQRRIKIPEDKPLADQLSLLMYEYTESGNIKIHHPEGGHDDEPDALALMAWGLLGSKRVNVTFIDTTNKTTVTYGRTLHVCDVDKLGCGVYFWQTNHNRHFLTGQVCLKCKAKD